METNQVSWVAFYEEFADKLLTYKNRRSELVLLGRAPNVVHVPNVGVKAISGRNCQFGGYCGGHL